VSPAAVAACRVAAYADLESEFIADADRVITGSEPPAAWLRRDYGLSRLPDVVLNAPIDVPEQAAVTGVRAPNHDIAVTNKFCECLAAGLPIATSDTPARATLVRELGPGAEYMAGDPYSLDSLDAR